LKIDRSFISDAMNSKGDQEIIKTIIAMARNLNIDAVAEGVETQEQKEFLTSYGCNRMQGFLFAHPVPVEQFKDLLERQREAARERQRVETVRRYHHFECRVIKKGFLHHSGSIAKGFGNEFNFSSESGILGAA
jgi:predicted signal transduction protein with EAL and GGDEF domain